MYDRKKAPGRWISILYRSAQTYINFRSEKFQLKRGQHRFLLQLFYKDGVRQGDLAKSLSIDKGAAARAISKLEKAGYVKRKKDKNDKRVVRVYLTEKAKNIENDMFLILSDWSEKLTTCFNDEEEEKLVTQLRKMARNADSILAELKEEPIII
jgi:DNA-binding MarR family transcriptional regulator